MRNLTPLAWLVASMIAVNVAWTPAILTISSLSPEAMRSTLISSELELTLTQAGWMLLTGIIFAIWLNLAGRNLLTAGYEDLEFSPGSRIWWFLVPIACLWKPFQGMRELWNTSHGEGYYDTSAGLVTTWWALYLGGSLVGGVLQAIAPTAPASSIPAWLACAIDAATGTVAILMVFRITQAQRGLGRASLGDVFA